jgi:ribonuclease VapC
MIVDASALLAILQEEPEAGVCTQALAQADVCLISAANFLEAAVVVDIRGDAIARRRFDDLIRDARIVIEPITELHCKLGREAYRDFGRGSGHPAKLNFGDCFAYALAKASGQPLLFVGNDFTHTDISVARPD